MTAKAPFPVPGPGIRLRRRWAHVRLLGHTVHDLGLRTIGQVVANSFRRLRARAAEQAARSSAEPPVAPGALRDVVADAAGARCTFAGATLEVAFLADDVVRLSWGPGTLPMPYAVPGDAPWPAPAVSVRESEGATVISGGVLEVVVADDGAVTVRRAGDVLWRALPPTRRERVWEQRFRTRAGERFFGLGEQSGTAERSGRSFLLWNQDPGGSWGPTAGPLYLSMPVLVATHPAGDVLSFHENSTYATVTLPSTGPVDGQGADGEGVEGEGSITFAGGMLRQFLMAGDVPHLLDRYSALTGRPALPPRWALGYHQSRWGYKREHHVLAVLDGYRRSGVPLSAVHLDIDYMEGYRVFTVDRRRFPDMAALARRAGDQGVRLVTIVDPAVKVDHGYALYRQGEEQGRFCRGSDGQVEVGVVWPGRAAFPDFTDPDTRRWWADQYRLLADAGISGIWHDMNEPTSIALQGDPTLPSSTRHHFDGRGGDHGEAHNVYGLLMNEAGADGLRRARPERRPWIVSRSGWAGSQRYAWNWTGDVETSWDGLRQQVATVVGLGLSGIAYSGPDIGGFSGVPDEELYLRWLQMSVLLPFCRTHSVVGAPSREPWRFAEPVASLIGSWIRFRYRLLPYLYTLAHQAAESGAPLARPPWWPAATSELVGVDDVFLLGDAVLVAPVTEPGARRRTVPLPVGNWSGLWSSQDASVEVTPGAGPVSVPAPLGRIPVLVRHGSVVPLDDGWAEPAGPCALGGDTVLAPGPAAAPPAPDHAPRLLAFHCWPRAGEARGVAVDDAGDGDGPVRHDELVLTGAHPDGEAVLQWRRSGAHPPPDRVRVVLHGFDALGARADGTDVEVHHGAVTCGGFEELRFLGLRALSPAGRGR